MKSFLASKHLNNMAPSNPNNPNNLSSLASRSQSQTSHLVNNPNSPNKPDVKQQTHSELASEALPYSTSSTGSELEGYLTEEEFIEVYHQELQGGKYWSVRHDLSVLGIYIYIYIFRDIVWALKGLLGLPGAPRKDISEYYVCIPNNP